jgi:hypothetical protein
MKNRQRTFYTYLSKTKWPYRPPTFYEAAGLGLVPCAFSQLVVSNTMPGSIQATGLEGFDLIVLVAMLPAICLALMMICDRLTDLLCDGTLWANIIGSAKLLVGQRTSFRWSRSLYERR